MNTEIRFVEKFVIFSEEAMDEKAVYMEFWKYLPPPPQLYLKYLKQN